MVGGPRFGVRSGVGANDPMDGLGHVRGRVGQITRMIGKSVKKASKQVFQKVGCSQVERGRQFTGQGESMSYVAVQIVRLHALKVHPGM